MFGEHGLKTGFIRVSEKKIHLVEEREGIVRYRRDDVERIIKASVGESLKIIPAPATGYGVKLLMVRVKEQVLLSPGESLEGFLEVPVEVEVRVGDAPVDRFNIGGEKYALYGSPELGVIARYGVSSFYLEEPGSTALMKISIENQSGTWKAIEKVVVPIQGTVMYYSDKKAYYPLVEVLLDQTVKILNTGRPPRENLTSTREPRPLPVFLMRW